MKTIEVSESALESLKAMAQKLQERNNHLLSAMSIIASAENSALDLAYCKGVARAAIAACQESTKVME